MFDKLRLNVRELGAWNAALYLLDRMLSAASGGRAHVYKYYLVAQPIPGAGVAPLRADTKVSIEPAGPGHPLRAHFPRPAHIVDKRFEQGARCLVAASSGSFAGYLWWQAQQYDEDEVRCLFVLAEPERSVWDFDVYVEPRYRLGRMMARLWDEATRRLHAQGVRWSFSRISAFNAGSIASHKRLGSHPIASAVFVVIGRWQLSGFTQRPFVHAAWRGRPVVKLNIPH